MPRKKWEELGLCPNCGASLEGCIEGGEPEIRAVKVPAKKPDPPVPPSDDTPAPRNDDTPAPRNDDTPAPSSKSFFDRLRGEGE